MGPLTDISVFDKGKAKQKLLRITATHRYYLVPMRNGTIRCTGANISFSDSHLAGCRVSQRLRFVLSILINLVPVKQDLTVIIIH